MLEDVVGSAFLKKILQRSFDFGPAIRKIFGLLRDLGFGKSSGSGGETSSVGSHRTECCSTLHIHDLARHSPASTEGDGQRRKGGRLCGVRARPPGCGLFQQPAIRNISRFPRGPRRVPGRLHSQIHSEKRGWFYKDKRWDSFAARLGLL